MFQNLVDLVVRLVISFCFVKMKVFAHDASPGICVYAKSLTVSKMIVYLKIPRDGSITESYSSGILGSHRNGDWTVLLLCLSLSVSGV